ncbi:MAG: hypothetical protein UR43_C0005G0087 [candidate division TM6 bacterium GW2011_GWF2_33_332]|nr:MAG: hypothetical protein UR43_C0005G0087 [candidate division TM6 bacterium GW2011_GWF2_33_332]
MKILEKRLGKFRSKNKELCDEIEELDVEAETKKALKTTPLKEDGCPKCGRDLNVSSVPHGELEICTNPDCSYRKVNRKKVKER